MTSCDTVPRLLRATNVYFLKCCSRTLLMVSTMMVSWSVSYKHNECGVHRAQSMLCVCSSYDMVTTLH